MEKYLKSIAVLLGVAWLIGARGEATAVAQNQPESVYFKKFVQNAGGDLVNRTPPQVTFTAFLNDDRSKVLVENAPRWDDGAPNIEGKGAFGVELGNFPGLTEGDTAYVRFTDNVIHQQGTLSQVISSIPWNDPDPFTKLTLEPVNLPAAPDSVQLTLTEKGYPKLSWKREQGVTYWVYRRVFQDRLFNGKSRFLYTRVADSLKAGSFTDTDVEQDKNYGYIVYARNQAGVWSSHSIDPSEAYDGCLTLRGWNPDGCKAQQPENLYDNGLAKTPPMGWNSWNKFGCNINADLIKETADAMVSSGMKDAGYEYINIDDCWMASSRDAQGRLQPDPVHFPNGIKAVADYVHSKGLKLGIYSSAGTHTCQGLPASLDHEQTDAQTFAGWGIDYLKYDNCNNEGRPAKQRFKTMSNALLNVGRPIVYSITEWGLNDPWKWAPSMGNLWRTTGDIWPRWSENGNGAQNSVMLILDKQVDLYQYSGPGHWNDPDMLEVGNDPLTLTESKAHFSLWAILDAPLIAGNDLRNMPDKVRNILTNREVIAVNQDSLGVQGRKIRDEGNIELWVKPLENGAVAVLMLNRGGEAATIETNTDEIGLPDFGSGSKQYTIRDLWTHTETTSKGSVSADVPSHGAAMFKVSASSTVSIDNPDSSPRQITLKQNYPNPFNPVTHIRYNLPYRQKVTLTVFDITGRKIKTLIDDVQPAGRHSAKFVGRGLASGMYLYRLQTDSFTSVRKMLLLK